MAAKTGNIIALYRVLYEYTDEEHPYTMRDIQDRLEEMHHPCSEDTILRYMNIMREWNIDVEAKMGRNASYYLSSRVLRKEELKLIVDAVNASNFIEPEIADEMTQKLKNLLSENQRGYLDRNVLGMVNNKTENRKILENVDVIQEACDMKAQISFTYMKWDRNLKLVPKSVKPEVVNPWNLIWADDRYYLYALKEKNGRLEERHYRVDKMKNVAIIENKSREGMSKVRNINPNTYVSRRMGMFTGEEKKIRIAAGEEMVGPIVDQFGRDIRVMENAEASGADDSLLIEFEAVPSIILLGWLAGLGGVEVLAPSEVRAGMIAMLDKSLSRYRR